MKEKVFSFINQLLAIGVLFLGGAALFFWIAKPSQISLINETKTAVELPKNTFSFPPASYYSIGEPVISLNFSGAILEVPDLRQQLIYYGKNGRPDADEERTLLHFSFNANKAICSAPPNTPLYLIYDQKQPGKYGFSPNNAETSLWIEAVPGEKEASIQVKMRNEKGDIVQEPKHLAVFQLQEKEYGRTAGTVWEIGQWRVDGSLFARQHARWYGVDRFLQNHGGEDFLEAFEKERVDFGENEDLYSIFVKPGDCIVWDDNRWKVVKPGHNSLGKPLLLVKKVEERLMTFDLWDVEGKGKIQLNLLKSIEQKLFHNIQQDFKFVGARTRSQCIFEINKERVLLQPNDWLLLSDGVWKKLNTSEEIDEYVFRKKTGILFVFDGIVKKDDHQMMVGKVYSPNRTEINELELLVHQGGISTYSADKDPEDEEEDEDEDEDEEEGEIPYARID